MCDHWSYVRTIYGSIEGFVGEIYSGYNVNAMSGLDS